MTRIFVDQTEIATPPTVLASLDQVLRHVESAVLPPNTVIRQIRLDGRPLVGDEHDESSNLLQSALDDRKTVEITTGTVWQVAEESIREAQAYLDRIVALIPSLATSFQISPGPEAFESLRQLYEGFYWLNLLVDRLEGTFQIQRSELALGETTATEHQHRFLEVLKMLVDAQERRDFLLIADLLEYEIVPMVTVWKELFVLLAEKVVNSR